MFLDIHYVEGTFCVNLPSGIPVPLRLAGEPVKGWLPGWTAKRLYCGLAPLFILEFGHSDGSEALWWLDEGLNHASLTAETLSVEDQTALLARLDSIFNRMWVEIFWDANPSLGRNSADLMQLSIAARRDIIKFWTARCNNRTQFVKVSHDHLQADVAARNSGVKLDRVASVLNFDLQDRIGVAFIEGGLILPSIYTASDLLVTQSVCLDTFRFIYRVVDRIYGKAFYVGVTGHHCIVSCAICLSAEHDIVFYETDTQLVQTKTILLQNARAELIQHLVLVGSKLIDYFSNASPTMVSVLRSEARHMGHLFWNELTGITKIVEQVPAARLPWIVIPNAAEGGEMYGPIDRIFPELKSHVVRYLCNTNDFKDFVYKQHCCVLRSTSLVVTPALRDHLHAYIDGDPQFDLHREAFKRLQSLNPTILTLGLRVENRTFTDLTACYVEILSYLARKFRNITIVVDGHNSSGFGENALVSSNEEWKATVKPIDIERSIVESLRQAAMGQDIRIVDTVGLSIPESIFWIARSSFFIAPWGTGMAKYCWACNLPGFVITSPWNRHNRGDIGIYEEPLNSGAAGLVWADDANVRPCPDAPILVEVAGWPRQSYENFDVNMAPLLDQMGAAIRASVVTATCVQQS